MPRRPAMVWLQFLVVAVGALAFAYAALGFYAWQYSDGLIFLPPPPTYPNDRDILHISARRAGRWRPVISRARMRATRWSISTATLRISGESSRACSCCAITCRSRCWRGLSRLRLERGSAGEPATLRAAQAVLAYVTGPLRVPADRVVLYDVRSAAVPRWNSPAGSPAGR